jgi:hypothetical protein
MSIRNHRFDYRELRSPLGVRTVTRTVANKASQKSPADGIVVALFWAVLLRLLALNSL